MDAQGVGRKGMGVAVGGAEDEERLASGIMEEEAVERRGEGGV